MVAENKSSSKTKEISLISQEILLVKILCSNDERERHRGLQKIKRWLKLRSQVVEFKEDDFGRIWKGLFFCMWMSDKPLYQEEVVDNISQLVHIFQNFDTCVTFLEAFFKIMVDEWFQIDYLRMDKMMMFVRRMMRHSFIEVKNHGWDAECLAKLADCYTNVINSAPEGLLFHVADIFLNELAKVGGNDLTDDVVLSLITPFGERMSTGHQVTAINHIACTVFLYLLRNSDVGVEQEEKFRAWKEQGFPSGSIDVMKKTYADCEESSSDDDESDDELAVLDPRAGNVDVEVPTINVDPNRIIDLLNTLNVRKATTMKARKQISQLIHKFRSVVSGKYPLGMHQADKAPKGSWRKIVKKCVAAAVDEEIGTSVEEADGESKETRRSQSNLRTSVGRWQVTVVNSDTGDKTYNGCSQTTFSPIKWQVLDKNEMDKDTFISKHNDSINLTKANKRKNYLDDNIKRKKLKTSRGIKNGITGEGNETEIIIKPLKRCKKKRKRKLVNGVQVNLEEDVKSSPDNSDTVSVETECAASEEATPTPVKNSYKRKRVFFVLNKNMVQEEREYQRIVRNQPRIQFDSKKQPQHPIFKDKGIQSPINPFYKRIGYQQVK